MPLTVCTTVSKPRLDAQGQGIEVAPVTEGGIHDDRDVQAFRLLPDHLGDALFVLRAAGIGQIGEFAALQRRL